jgi:repressor LexA
MQALTDRQAAILAFLQEQIAQHGLPPTRADIARHFGFSSRASAEDQLRALERKGYIEIVADSARGIRLSAKAQMSTHASNELPLIGSIAAGTPILAEVNIESRVFIDAALFHPRADFLHRVSGHSMKDADILDGDLVGIRAQSTADNHQIVAAVVTDRKTGEEMITLKRYVRRGSRVILKPENSSHRYQPIEIDLADFEGGSQESSAFRIAGIFAGLVRVPR